MSQNYKKAPEKQSLQGVIFILPLRVNQILPDGVNAACPRGSNARGFSRLGFDSVVNGKQNEFWRTLLPFMEKYGQSMLERFQADWAAPVNGTTTLLWETKKSWSVSYRLKSWSKSHQELEAQVSEIRLERTRKKSAPQAGNDEGQKLLAAQREEANARLEQEIKARKEGAVSYEEYIRRKNKTTT